MTLRRGFKGYVAMAYAGLSVVAAIVLVYLVARSCRHWPVENFGE